MRIIPMSKMKELQNSKLAVFGSTGSIGLQTLDVARLHNIPIDCICAMKNINALESQIREFKPRICAVYDPDAAKLLKIAVADTDTRIYSGKEGVCAAAQDSTAKMLLNSVMGMAGLMPTLAAIDSGKNIALANKETLVAAGEIVMRAARDRNVQIIPVDSEHCAIHQCLSAGAKNEVRRLILTCSGGSYFGKKREELYNITPEEAVCHPKWNMGRKISVDSSSLMNKGLEIIEAAWLFDMDVDHIDVIIHRESIIHSMVEYIDHAVIAQMSVPDMRLCVQYALTYPERYVGCTEALDLEKFQKLTFYKPDEETFCLLPLARRAAKEGGIKPTVLNAANEQAVELFLNKKIRFLDIFDSVSEVVSQFENQTATLEHIHKADLEARRKIEEFFC